MNVRKFNGFSDFFHSTIHLRENIIDFIISTKGFL